MNLFSPEMLRSFAIGFVLGLAALAMSMGLPDSSPGLVTPAVAATHP